MPNEVALEPTETKTWSYKDFLPDEEPVDPALDSRIAVLEGVAQGDLHVVQKVEALRQEVEALRTEVGVLQFTINSIGPEWIRDWFNRHIRELCDQASRVFAEKTAGFTLEGQVIAALKEHITT